MAHAFDHAHAHAGPAAAAPLVRQVSLAAPIQWLRLGARDLHRSLRPSIAVGALFAWVGWLVMAATWQASYLAPALLSGFVYVAPFAAIAIYGYSRQLERGDALDTREALWAWRANTASIAMFGLMLALTLIFWERVAAIIFAVFFRGEPLQFANLFTSLVLSGAHLPMLVTLGIVGALIAAVVFSLSVVTAPMLMDRPVDVVTAAITSVQCCLRNPLPMLLWAVLIAGITWIGLLTFMVGLVVILPWLAHASWHAYRGLVEPAA